MGRLSLLAWRYSMLRRGMPVQALAKEGIRVNAQEALEAFAEWEDAPHIERILHKRTRGRGYRPRPHPDRIQRYIKNEDALALFWQYHEHLPQWIVIQRARSLGRLLVPDDIHDLLEDIVVGLDGSPAICLVCHNVFQPHIYVPIAHNGGAISRARIGNFVAVWSGQNGDAQVIPACGHPQNPRAHAFVVRRGVAARTQAMTSSQVRAARISLSAQRMEGTAPDLFVL